MSEKYKVGDSIRPHFMTMTVVDWVDLFTRKVYRDIIVDSLNYCIKSKGMIVYGYCIMPSHLHIIACSAKIPLSEMIMDFKRFACRSFINAIKVENESRRAWLLRTFSHAAERISRGVNYKVWRDGFHPIELTDNKMMDQKLEYIHQNPVVEGFVSRAEDWNCSSARYYICQEENEIALQMLE